MIFVITGTERFQFDRLIKCIDELRGSEKISQEVMVQLGSCQYEPKHCSWRRFLDFSEMKKNIDSADLVIAHAGAGTTLLCMNRGGPLIIVPRRKKYLEHVDDHQVPFARMIEQLNSVEVVWETKDLLSTIQDSHLLKQPTRHQTTEKSALSNHVNGLLDDWYLSGKASST